MMTLSLVGLFAFFGTLLSTFLILRSRRLGATIEASVSRMQGSHPIAVIEDEVADAPDVDELIEKAGEESKRKQRKIARDMAKRQRKIERELAD